MIIQEVLLSGLALNYIFHGLSAGTEYTISVTAATGAGLGTQATITATTATLQNIEAAISVPGRAYSTYCTPVYCVTFMYIHNMVLMYISLSYSCRVCVWHTGTSCHCTGCYSHHMVRQL